ncbi:hypothetical protein PC114_g2661 [Phytophthora cactorum]|nr:hypothetical protein PC114_g2661 [Phytophthora cactorum]
MLTQAFSSRATWILTASTGWSPRAVDTRQVDILADRHKWTAVDCSGSHRHRCRDHRKRAKLFNGFLNAGCRRNHSSKHIFSASQKTGTTTQWMGSSRHS